MLRLSLLLGGYLLQGVVVGKLLRSILKPRIFCRALVLTAEPMLSGWTADVDTIRSKAAGEGMVALDCAEHNNEI